jgi:hypothetical protein
MAVNRGLHKRKFDEPWKNRDLKIGAVEAGTAKT